MSALLSGVKTSGTLKSMEGSFFVSGQKNDARRQAAAPGDVEQRRDLHADRAVHVGDVEAFAGDPVGHPVVDHAVAKRAHARQQRRVRGVRDAGVDGLAAFGFDAGLGQRPDDGQIDGRILQVKVREAVDGDQHHMAARLSVREQAEGRQQRRGRKIQRGVSLVQHSPGPGPLRMLRRLQVVWFQFRLNILNRAWPRCSTSFACTPATAAGTPVCAAPRTGRFLSRRHCIDAWHRRWSRRPCSPSMAAPRTSRRPGIRQARETVVTGRVGRDCAFFEPGRGRLCAIHRQFGHDALPSACQHFPRVVVIDPRGVFVEPLARVPDGRSPSARSTGRAFRRGPRRAGRHARTGVGGARRARRLAAAGERGDALGLGGPDRVGTRDSEAARRRAAGARVVLAWPSRASPGDTGGPGGDDSLAQATEVALLPSSREPRSDHRIDIDALDALARQATTQPTPGHGAASDRAAADRELVAPVWDSLWADRRPVPGGAEHGQRRRVSRRQREGVGGVARHSVRGASCRGRRSGCVARGSSARCGAARCGGRRRRSSPRASSRRRAAGRGALPAVVDAGRAPAEVAGEPPRPCPSWVRAPLPREREPPQRQAAAPTLPPAAPSGLQTRWPTGTAAIRRRRWRTPGSARPGP